MEFERTDCDISGDARYQTEKDGKRYLIQITDEAFQDDLQITEEAMKDDLKRVLTPDQLEKLERIVLERIANGLFKQMTDKSGALYDVILIKTGDLA